MHAIHMGTRSVPVAEPASSRESSKLVTLDSSVAAVGIFGSNRLVLFFLTSFSMDNEDHSLLNGACSLDLIKLPNGEFADEKMQMRNPDRNKRRIGLLLNDSGETKSIHAPYIHADSCPITLTRTVGPFPSAQLTLL